jgi:hypothetical protein
MCRQCCIAQSGCNVRSHNFVQLSARQRSKLPEPSATPQANKFPLDPSLCAMSSASGASYKILDPILAHPSPPVSHPNDEEKQQYEAAITASLQPTSTPFLSPSTIEEDQQQYAAAITASLRLPDAFSAPSQVSMSSHPFSEFRHSVSAAGPGSSRPAISIASHPSTNSSAKVRTVPYRPPNIREHMSEDWMRPPEDRTKKPKRVNRINLDNRFSLVFWYEVRYLVI